MQEPQAVPFRSLEFAGSVPQDLRMTQFFFVAPRYRASIVLRSLCSRFLSGSICLMASRSNSRSGATTWLYTAVFRFPGPIAAQVYKFTGSTYLGSRDTSTFPAMQHATTAMDSRAASSSGVSVLSATAVAISPSHPGKESGCIGSGITRWKGTGAGHASLTQ